SVFLRAGKRYVFTMTYRQERDIARARLLWSNAVEQRKELIPRSQLHGTLRAQTPPKKQGTGLPGQYFSGENFEQPAFARLDPDINFHWEKQSPKPGSLNKEHYSVRWTGEIEAQKTDFYQFSSHVDDRIKIVIDGHTVLDTTRVRAGKTNFALPILLQSGRRYPVIVEYAQYIDTAYVDLLWSASDGKRGVIPAEALYGTLVPVAGTGLRGEYFAGENFETLKSVHPAEAIHFDWRESVPDSAVPADHFSVRWTGWIEAPTTDDYTFTVRVDDGVRLWIDDELLLNEWRRVSEYMVEFRFEKRMEKGKRRPIKVEYFEFDKPAGIQLFWEKNGKPREPVPRSALYPTAVVSQPSQTVPVSGTGTGLYAEYFSDPNHSSLAASRVDSRIDFMWDYNAPTPSLPSDWFSARWTGWIEAPQTADYTFTVRVDDGIRLWIGEEKILDRWHRVSTYPAEYRVKQFLKQGRYPIRVEFYEEDSPAGIRFLWEYANRSQEVVPTRFLYPAPEPIQPPGNGTGLRGRYYKGADTADQLALPYPVVERTDPSVGFSWGAGSPDFRIPGDSFSARWDGFIQPRYSGTYTFYLTADDRATLFIDDSPITTSTPALITSGSDVGREYTATKTLSRDRLYHVRIVYRENAGDARIHFSWSHDRIPKEIVPRAQLYLPGTSILAPLGQ
ncbi:MAG: PA14 domain-containing protein, partial [Patescibacteria group bacterium]